VQATARQGRGKGATTPFEPGVLAGSRASCLRFVDALSSGEALEFFLVARCRSTDLADPGSRAAQFFGHIVISDR
jgi:hypothetical protein